MTEKDIIRKEIQDIQSDIEFGSAPMSHIERLTILQDKLKNYDS
jgi:hypothetical protein